MIRNIQLLISLLVLSLLAACGRQSTPDQVASTYWEAVARADVETVRKLTAEQERDWIQDDWPGVPQIARVEVDAVQADGDEVRVPTRLTLGEDSGASPAKPLHLETLLVREDGAWRVRNQATMAQFAGAMAAYTLRRAGEALRRGIEETGAAMQEGMRAFQREMQDEAGDGAAASAPDDAAAAATADARALEASLQKDMDAFAAQMQQAGEEMMKAMDRMAAEPAAEDAPAPDEAAQ